MGYIVPSRPYRKSGGERDILPSYDRGRSLLRRPSSEHGEEQEQATRNLRGSHVSSYVRATKMFYGRVKPVC
jgi:hypothetical protein